MEKRNKSWRAQQRKLHYVRRLKVQAVSWDWYPPRIKGSDGKLTSRPNWKDLYNNNWFPALRTTSTPCSCWMCSPNKYKRKNFKKETRMLLKLELESDF